VFEDARSVGDAEAQVLALDALARHAARRGDRRATTGLLRAADEAAARIGHLVDRADRLDAAAAERLLAATEP
jgi:hypothetical protein